MKPGDFDFSNEASMAEQIARLLNDNALLLAIRDAVAAHKASFGKCLADALEAERDIYRALDAYDNRDGKEQGR